MQKHAPEPLAFTCTWKDQGYKSEMFAVLPNQSLPLLLLAVLAVVELKMEEREHSELVILKPCAC